MFRSQESQSGRPLLPKDDDDARASADYDRGRRSASRSPRHSPPPSGPLYTPPSATSPATPGFQRPTFSRRSTMRSRSPATNARMAARRKYTYAAFFLVLSLVSFTVQTELAAWVQHAGWDKAYCMLYLTHGSWTMLWPVQLLVLRLQKRDMPWDRFWRRHVWLLRTTAVMVERRELDIWTSNHHSGERGWRRDKAEGNKSLSPEVRYFLGMVPMITAALTVAGLSWYIAVSMTTPSDLTAIYNCSAFFAYVFSVPMLHERLRLDKSLAVLLAIVGVLVVAYGDSKGESGGSGESEVSSGSRFLGNVIIGAGSVLYGLYEVLYKKYGCPPDGCSPGRSMIFANAFGSMIGVFTLLVLWIPLPILHILDIETFSLPTGRVAWYLFLSVVMNATFAGSFLVLISLTSPVLSSVASLLTIFIVAVSDWLLTGVPPSVAALFGGGMIVIAFAMLSWSTYREMTEDEKKKQVDLSESGDDDDSDTEALGERSHLS